MPDIDIMVSAEDALLSEEELKRKGKAKYCIERDALARAEEVGKRLTWGAKEQSAKQIRIVDAMAAAFICRQKQCSASG